VTSGLKKREVGKYHRENQATGRKVRLITDVTSRALRKEIVVYM
jgi:hypothetical protein